MQEQNNKMQYYNNKTAGFSSKKPKHIRKEQVPIARYQNSITKEQVPKPRCRNAITKLQVSIAQYQVLILAVITLHKNVSSLF